MKEHGERLKYKLQKDPKDEKNRPLPEDNQEALVGPPSKILIRKNDIIILNDHIEL
jgi:hypothetical protein